MGRIIARLSESQFERLARLLGECGTGTDINRVLHDRGLPDDSGESTKWRRLYWVFHNIQEQHKCANKVLDFIQCFMSPIRFVGRSDDFDNHREDLNAILAFSGIELHADGKLRERAIARTLDEAERRVKSIRDKFKSRSLHSEVVKYCNVELMQDNYFHAVFEAAKGLAQRIRDMVGIEKDGAALIDKVFSIERPLLALNRLETATERSEHIGFAALLKGCFGAVRNPLAHQPKILWEGEDDAADYLSLISLLHRRLDRCVPTGLGEPR